jgi:Mrp family chromosome partitioning ATPase
LVPVNLEQQPEAPRNTGDGKASLDLVHISELLGEPDEPENWLVDGLLPTGGLSVLVGKPKAGKSTLARALAVAVARGEPWLGRATFPGDGGDRAR